MPENRSVPATSQTLRECSCAIFSTMPRLSSPLHSCHEDAQRWAGVELRPPATTTRALPGPVCTLSTATTVKLSPSAHTPSIVKDRTFQQHKWIT
ncbi:hypothetical protein SORBI_3009G000801 [Sorghum bicolor]|uniref:Uncharacterized protein n=1 Tax=Sorghum bicolor TaxID=4558 RepID=A0A1Z5R1A4_SORBI|nr:hypothetical protein SORBI_3009G000801 [Sorghum bicolor]